MGAAECKAASRIGVFAPRTEWWRQGVKAGVPDICLPVARNGYHGLYIELKAGKNTATQNQKRWLNFLNSQGYKAVICYGWQTAKDEIVNYLK